MKITFKLNKINIEKSTKHETDNTATIVLSIEEWENIFNASKKPIKNFYSLLHKRLYEELKGCCPFGNESTSDKVQNG